MLRALKRSAHRQTLRPGGLVENKRYALLLLADGPTHVRSQSVNSVIRVPLHPSGRNVQQVRTKELVGFH